MWGESIFAMDLNGVQSVLMAGIIWMLQLCVENLGIRQMVSLVPIIIIIPIFMLLLALANNNYHALQVHNQSITPLMKMILLY